MMKNELREKLAAYAHNAWAGWMRYMFGKGMSTIQADDNGKTVTFWTMEPALYERWQRQMNTPYVDLPESEKASDREEADKMLALLFAQKGADEILRLLLAPRDDEANMDRYCRGFNDGIEFAGQAPPQPDMQQMMAEIRQATGRCAVASFDGKSHALGDGLWLCKYGGSGASWHGASAYSPEQAVSIAWERACAAQEAQSESDDA